MKNALTAIACLALLAACLPLGGCQSGQAFGLMPVAQHKAAIQTIADAEGSIADEHLAWAGAIAQQTGAKPLPDLSKATDDQRAAWYRARQVRRDELKKVLTTQVSQ
jgi:hypothetical protein